MPLGMEVGLGPGHTVLHLRDLTQLPPPERGPTARTFRPMTIVAKRSPISATAEFLFVQVAQPFFPLRCDTDMFHRSTCRLRMRSNLTYRVLKSQSTQNVNNSRHESQE